MIISKSHFYSNYPNGSRSPKEERHIYATESEDNSGGAYQLFLLVFIWAKIILIFSLLLYNANGATEDKAIKITMQSDLGTESKPLPENEKTSLLVDINQNSKQWGEELRKDGTFFMGIYSDVSPSPKVSPTFKKLKISDFPVAVEVSAIPLGEGIDLMGYTLHVGITYCSSSDLICMELLETQGGPYFTNYKIEELSPIIYIAKKGTQKSSAPGGTISTPPSSIQPKTTNEPTSANEWNEKGLALLKGYKYKEANECFNNALAIDPDNYVFWFNKGIALSFLSDSGAIESLLKSVEFNRSNARAWYNLGVLFDYHNRKDTALEAYAQAVKDDPNYLKAYRRIGKIFDDVEDYNNAAKYYKEITIRNPSDDQAWYKLANSYYHQKKYESALVALDKAIALNPDDQNAEDDWNLKATVLDDLGRYEEGRKSGINYLKTYLKLHPADAQQWYNLGGILKEDGRYSEADAAFAKAKELGYK